MTKVGTVQICGPDHCVYFLFFMTFFFLIWGGAQALK